MLQIGDRVEVILDKDKGKTGTVVLIGKNKMYYIALDHEYYGVYALPKLGLFSLESLKYIGDL